MAENVTILIDHINRELLQVHLIEDTSVNGIQVEGSKKLIRTIGTAVTASQEVIERASIDKVDLLLVHHGLFLKGAFNALTGSLCKKVHMLLEHGITLAGYHLPLDSHPSLGNAWSLPLDLGWKNIAPICPYKGCHLGVLASLPGTMSTEALSEVLIEYFAPVTGTCYMVFPKQSISRVAFLPGGCHKYLHEVVQTGADCFITGTSDEPIWHIAQEEKISFLSFGHHATEKRGIQNLGNYLASKYGLDHIFYDVPNPF